MKQGCLLSPSLFNLYINDLIEFISLELGIECGKYANIPILAYADDIVLLAPSADSLQMLLNVLQSWCSSNGIKVNSDKTKVMHFRKQHRPRSKSVLLFNNEPLDYCQEYKYLGLWVNEHLKVNAMLQRVSLSSKLVACIMIHSITYTTLW